MSDFVEINRIVGRLGSAETAVELFGVVRDEVSALGFERFCYRNLATASGKPQTFMTSNYPVGWTARYRSKDYGEDDVLLHQGLNTLLPFSWSQVVTHPKVTDAQRRVLNEAGEFDLKAGGVVPIRGPGSSRGLFFVANGMRHSEFDALFEVHRHVLHLIAIYTHERANELIEPSNPELIPRLTHRETEVLKWTVRGKTSWEVAQILSLSEATIKEHIRNICRKFGVKNKTHATCLAIRDGFISV